MSDPSRGGTGIATTTVVAALLMMLTWGSSSVAIKVGLGSYDPGQLTLLRFIVTTVIMVGYALVTRMRLPARRDVLPLLGLGIIGISITQIAFSFGITTVDPGTAMFLVATVPVMAATLAWLVLGERLSVAGWAGIGLTVVGTTVLVLGQGRSIGFTQGAVILLIGAFAEAWYFILQKPFLRRYTSGEVSTWALIASTLPLLIFAPALPAQFATAAPSATAAVVYCGLGAGVIGYVCMSVVNARLPAAIAAVLMAGLPPVALGSAWLVLGIAPPLLSVLGGVIAIIGVVVVTLRGRAAAVVPFTPAPVVD